MDCARSDSVIRNKLEIAHCTESEDLPKIGHIIPAATHLDRDDFQQLLGWIFSRIPQKNMKPTRARLCSMATSLTMLRPEYAFEKIYRDYVEVLKCKNEKELISGPYNQTIIICSRLSALLSSSDYQLKIQEYFHTTVEKLITEVSIITSPVDGYFIFRIQFVINLSHQMVESNIGNFKIPSRLSNIIISLNMDGIKIDRILWITDDYSNVTEHLRSKQYLNSTRSAIAKIFAGSVNQ
ncbi:hypothetical protein ACOME3_003083 [Neoechinorhynchus agilis]